MAVSGSAFGGRSSPSLTDLLVYASGEIDDPTAPTGAGGKLQFPRGNALGSGSDFTGYLQHLGIASVDMGFNRNSRDAVYHYHSQYDSFVSALSSERSYRCPVATASFRAHTSLSLVRASTQHWMNHFGDPDWTRHTAVAKAFGLAALKAASNLFVPLNITAYAEELGTYVDKVVKLADGAEHHVEGIDFAALHRGVRQIQFSAAALDRAKVELARKLRRELEEIDAATKKKEREPHKHPKHPGSKPGPTPTPPRKELRRIIQQIRAVNAKVSKFEQGFIAPGEGEGLPAASGTSTWASRPGATSATAARRCRASRRASRSTPARARSTRSTESRRSSRRWRLTFSSRATSPTEIFRFHLGTRVRSKEFSLIIIFPHFLLSAPLLRGVRRYCIHTAKIAIPYGY